MSEYDDGKKSAAVESERPDEFWKEYERLCQSYDVEKDEFGGEVTTEELADKLFQKYRELHPEWFRCSNPNGEYRDRRTEQNSQGNTVHYECKEGASYCVDWIWVGTDKKS